MTNFGASTLYGIGGGNVFTSRTVHSIISTALGDTLRRTPESRPINVVNLPTAKATPETYWRQVGWLEGHLTYPSYYGSVTTLHGFMEAPDLEAAAAALETTDVLFVPGGSTRQALDLWFRWGLDRLIVEVIQRGITVIGHSAGLIAWWEGMNTDSMSYEVPDGNSWRYTPLPGLGLLPGRCCPHAADNARQYTHNTMYGYEETRRDVFVKQLRVTRTNGIAVDGETAIKVQGDLVTVLGDGRVTTHRWDDQDRLVETEYVQGRIFRLSTAVSV